MGTEPKSGSDLKSDRIIRPHLALLRDFNRKVGSKLRSGSTFNFHALDLGSGFKYPAYILHKPFRFPLYPPNRVVVDVTPHQQSLRGKFSRLPTRGNDSLPYRTPELRRKISFERVTSILKRACQQLGSEIRRYLADPNIPSSEDPVAWWKTTTQFTHNGG